MLLVFIGMRVCRIGWVERLKDIFLIVQINHKQSAKLCVFYNSSDKIVRKGGYRKKHNVNNEFYFSKNYCSKWLLSHTVINFAKNICKIVLLEILDFLCTFEAIKFWTGFSSSWFQTASQWRQIKPATWNWSWGLEILLLIRIIILFQLVDSPILVFCFY